MQYLKIRFLFALLSLFLLGLGFVACTKDGQLNLISLADERQLGEQLHQEILSKPSEYPILSRTEHPEAYAYLEEMRDELLESYDFTHEDDFTWDVYIIHDDNVLNAFAAPAGRSYYYTGLIKFLDTEDQLAGVMGHELAHADRRHATRNMTKTYGLSILLEVALGQDSGTLTEIAKGLAGNLSSLGFSRKTETEADEFSVKYLAPSRYQCNGAAGFFEKMEAQGGGSNVPTWMSTHPDSQDRIEHINAEAEAAKCSISPSGRNYARFKSLLP